MVPERLRQLAARENVNLEYESHSSDRLLRLLTKYIEGGRKDVTEESFGKPNWAYFRAYIDGWNARNKSVLDLLDGLMERGPGPK